MLKNIQSPASIHQKLISNIIETTKVAFDGEVGYVNAKDFQLQCLIEYEKMRKKGTKQRRRAVDPNGLIGRQTFQQKLHNQVQ